ncbi:MAG: hypothetical protein K2X45_07970 [Phreatobacter sp.]|nr:hypothetical protein [Phreatobacter sp.]
MNETSTELESRIDNVARTLFDAEPHNNPSGPPVWDRQPDHIKTVYRKLARRHLGVEDKT